MKLDIAKDRFVLWVKAANFFFFSQKMKHNCWGVFLLMLSFVMPQLSCAFTPCRFMDKVTMHLLAEQTARREEQVWCWGVPVTPIGDGCSALPSSALCIQLLPLWLTFQVWMVLPFHSAALCLQSMGGSFWKKMLSSQILYSLFCAGGRKWER